MSRAIPLEDRLENRYRVDTRTGCWLWLGDKRNGYGSVWVNGVRGYAHRAIYELYNGTIPTGMNACHRCDTPACVNPDHIFIGTQRDNIADMAAKGRSRRPPLHHGEAHHFAKLTLEKVDQIRLRYKRGESQYALAREYEVSQTTISQVVRNTTWVHEGQVAS